jgi:hypothetical protein
MLVHLYDDVVYILHVKGGLEQKHHGRTLWVRVTARACHGLVAVLRVQSNISERKERKNSRCFSLEGAGRGGRRPRPRPGPGY